MSRGTRWTPVEDVVLLRMTAAGTPQRGIAAALDRPLSSISSRLDRLGAPQRGPVGQRVLAKAGGAGERRARNCLCCGREFESAHCMNRLCGNCRRQSASPFDA